MPIHQKLPEKLRKAIAIDVLENSGYETKGFLGMGSYNVVFKCINPQGKLVAAKVVIARSKDEIDKKSLNREIESAIELEKMRPINWDKFGDSFLESIAPKAKKQAKYYFKYINSPAYEGTFEWIYGGERYFIAIFEASLVNEDAWDAFIKSRNTGVDFEELRRMARHVLKALVYLHSHGRVHLDIKPKNILKLTISDGNVAKDVSGTEIPKDSLEKEIIKNNPEEEKTNDGSEGEVTKKCNLQKKNKIINPKALQKIVLPKKADIN
jgi:Serine/threonine protein kinase